MMYVEGRLHQEMGNWQYQNQNRPVYRRENEQKFKFLQTVVNLQ